MAAVEVEANDMKGEEGTLQVRNTPKIVEPHEVVDSNEKNLENENSELDSVKEGTVQVGTNNVSNIDSKVEKEKSQVVVDILKANSPSNSIDPLENQAAKEMMNLEIEQNESLQTCSKVGIDGNMENEQSKTDQKIRGDENANVTLNALENQPKDQLIEPNDNIVVISLNEDQNSQSDSIKETIVHNICNLIEQSIAKEDVFDVISPHGQDNSKECDNVEDSNAIEMSGTETIVDPSVSDEQVVEAVEQIENEHSTEKHVENSQEPIADREHAEILVDKVDEPERKTYFESQSSKSCDYEDQGEKSDSSDSGIGSEPTDELITKSDTSSQSSTEDEEFVNASKTLGHSDDVLTDNSEIWLTPCMSFSDLNDDESSNPPRLPMPTFDDLTKSPCDVFIVDKMETSNSRLDLRELDQAEKEIDVEGIGGQDSIDWKHTECSKLGVNKELNEEEDIDIGSMDDESKLTLESVSFLPTVRISASMLNAVPNIPSTSRQCVFKSNLKRANSGGCDTDLPPTKKEKKGITFDNVCVYYFPRMQGFTCVPSQGGSTLGMSWTHSHVQTFTLSQYAAEQRRVHQRMAKSPHSLLDSGSMSCDSNDDTDSDDQFSDQDFDSDSSYTLQVRL